MEVRLSVRRSQRVRKESVTERIQGNEIKSAIRSEKAKRIEIDETVAN